MRRFISLTLILFSCIQLQAQVDDDDYYALIPSNFYGEFQLGLVVPSFQDLKSSSLSFTGIGIPLMLNAGYKNDSRRISLENGFYISSSNAFNGQNIFMYNWRTQSRLTYQQHLKTFKKKRKKTFWYAGGSLGMFYDVRNNPSLINNKNNETLNINLALSSTLERKISIKNQDYNLSWQVQLPILGFISESHSFITDIPQSDLVDGVFNYQSYQNTIMEGLEFKTIGGFIDINSSLTLERTYTFKNRKIDALASYDWRMFYYNNDNEHPLILGTHQVKIGVRYYFLKINPE